MKNFLKSIWNLITRPNPLLMLIFFILAGLSIYGNYLTGWVFFYVLAGIFAIYPVVLFLIGMVYAGIGTAKDIKNKNKSK